MTRLMLRALSLALLGLGATSGCGGGEGSPASSGPDADTGGSAGAADGVDGGGPADTGGSPTGDGQAPVADAAGPDPDDGVLPPDAGPIDIDDGVLPADAAPIDPDDGVVGPDAAPPLGDAGEPEPDAAPLPPVAGAALRINEVMVSNQLSLADEAGNNGDWIELYNTGDAPVDLTGFTLSYDFGEVHLSSVMAPGVVVPPRGHTLLWADLMADSGPTHVNVSFEKEAGLITLAAPDGRLVDRVQYFEQTPDLSFARTPDGSTQWAVLWEISPGAANPAGTGGPTSAEDPARPPESAPAAGRVADRLFNTIPEYRLTISAEGIQSLRDAPREYVEGTLTYGGRTYGPVAVRLKGQNSFLPIDRKPSFKIKANAYDRGAEFFGLDSLTLNNMSGDSSMVHERLGYYVARTAGLTASRAGHAVVYVNGEFYGLYSHLETVDDKFLEANFADPNGSLYEGYDVDFTPALVPQYEHQQGPDDRTLLLALADALLIEDPVRALAAADRITDMDQFRLYWGVCSVIGQFDSFPYGSPGDDYHVYAEPESMRLTFIPWGMDETFSQPDRSVLGVNSVLARRCIEDASCTALVKAQVYDVLRLTEDLDLAAEAQRVMDEVAPFVALDTHKPYTDATVAGTQAAMLQFIQSRRAAIARQFPEP